MKCELLERAVSGNYEACVLSHFCHMGAMGKYHNLSVWQPVLGLVIQYKVTSLRAGNRACLSMALDITGTHLGNIWESSL